MPNRVASPELCSTPGSPDRSAALLDRSRPELPARIRLLRVIAICSSALSWSSPLFAAPAVLAAYDFDAGAGTTLSDRSGNNLNGTLINGPLWTSGKYGGGLAFDGANDYVSMGDVAQADGLTSVTVSAWVKFAVNGGGASETHLVDKSHCSGHTNGGPWELGVSLTSSRKAEFLIYPQGGSPAAYVFSGPSSTSIDDGAWHHVTGRYDGSQISIWVDGVQENSRPLVGVTMPNTSYGVELGGRCNGYAYPFRGVLDDVRIYTRALTPSEISADMATTVGGGASPQPDATAPSTPTGLASSNVTSSQIGLAWQASTDNVGVTGYRVYRNGSLVATTTATNHTSTGLSSNTSYVFTVAAFDAASNTSTQSNPLAVTTPPPQPQPDTAAPSTPTGLASSNVTSSQIGLAWQASTDNVGVTGYRVYRNGSLVATTTATNHTSTGLSSNTSYVFTVAAFDAASNTSTQSSPLAVTTPPPPPQQDTTAPSTPTGLAPSNVTSSQIGVTWAASTDNVGVTGYRVYRNGSLVATTAATNHTSTGLSSNTSYAFTVAAFDAASNTSTQSNPLAVTTSSATSPPQTSSPLAAYDFDAGAGSTLADRSGNNLSGMLINGPLWTSGRYGGGLAFDGADDYVSMGDVAQADGLTSVTVSAWVRFAVNGGGASETHLIDKSHCSGHTNGGPWELGVSLTSSRKAEFLIYLQGGNPAAYVFSGPSSTSIDDGAWHYVTGRYDGSRVSIWVDGVQENSRPISGATMPSTSYAVELGGRCNGYAYPFRGVLDDVRIYTRALTPSEISADMSTPIGSGGGGTTPPPPDTTAPSTPTGLTSSNVTSSQIGVTWAASTDNVGVTGYRVYRNGSLVATTTATNHTSTGLSSNTSYVFTVAAFDAASNTSTQSNPLAVTTAASSTGSYTTNFNLTENPISEGGRWHGPNGTGFTNVRTANGNAFGTNGVTDTYDDSYAYMTGFTNDHEVEAVIHRGTVPNFNHEVELHLRVSESGGETYLYEILFNKDGAFQVVRWNGWRGGGGSYDITDLTSIGTGPGHSSAPANGDTVRARIVGQTITVWYNGSQIWTYTDNDAAKLTTGNPGIGFFYRPGATPSAFGFQSVTVRAL